MMTDESSSEKDQPTAARPNPQSQSLVQLRIGPRSVAAGCCILLLQLSLVGYARTSFNYFGMQLWIAAMWSGWAMCIWWTVRQPVQMKRVLMLGAAIAWHCILMALARGLPPERYFIMFGGFGCMQMLAIVAPGFHWWRGWHDPIASPQGRLRFNTLGLIAITTIVAGVMVALRRYGSDIDPQIPPHFLTGSLLINAMMVIQATAAMLCSMTRYGVVTGLPCVTVLALTTSASAAWLDIPTQTTPFAQVWYVYLTVITLFGWLIWGVSVAGRLDAQAQLRTSSTP